MTKPEFQSEMKLIAACFPKFKPESWTQVYRAYYESLAGFPISALQGARQIIVHDPNRGGWGTAVALASDFPTAPELFDLCRVWMQRQVHPTELRPNFPPGKHVCHPKAVDGKYGKANSTRLLLHKVNRYEGLHCKCLSEATPVCPVCGKVQEKWVNPFISKLMELFPKDTLGWNPLHKGWLLCPEHENYRGSQ
jgi:hypothetical protein